MSTVNMIKYYFYEGLIPRSKERIRQLITLAYQTARDRKIYPKAILIRSEVHPTTSINGIRIKDPSGLYVTFCYKYEDQLLRGTHVASHGYVKDKATLKFVQATHHPEKSDLAKRQKGKTFWPAEEELIAAPEIAYSHLPIGWK
ncbi:hypothetical protein N7478_008703 [Penicillium angulare]|uniref:uncharacterized protein n=1 Tax=Penicillium angulare TaxID=116970 RepID=UPI002541BD2F|nr:uncharacterized protein N7478_008703 [Penicillium angulare]KAJ5273578.1 hypothetical protein N7478_008703 [Penicillium angulare]